MMRALIATSLAMACSAAHAELHLQLHSNSHHFQERLDGKAWNERNPGLALRYSPSPDWSAQVGAYRNSEFARTYYALADWTPLQAGQFSAGVFGGAATGYRERPIQPLGGALVRWQGDRFSVTARIAPRADRKSSAVATVEFGMRIDNLFGAAP